MLNEEVYRKVYENLYSEAPKEIWEEFLSKMRELSEIYKKEQSEDVFENIKSLSGEDREIAEYVVNGISVGKMRFINKTFMPTRIEKISKAVGINKPSKETASLMRTISGGTFQKIKKYKNLKENSEKINEDFSNGMSLTNIAKKYKTSVRELKSVITSELPKADQVIANETKSLLSEREDSFYFELLESHPDWALSDLENYIMNEILKDKEFSKKTVGFYLRSIGLSVDKDRQNRARSIKSKNEKNTSYSIKKRSIDLIEKSRFKSVDHLTILYCENKIGTYNTISSLIEEDTGEIVSTRQLSKLISGNENYVKRRSRTEQIFIEMVKDALSLTEENIEREFRFDKSNQSSVDLYIPSMSLAFEFNGDYWHSDEIVRFNYGISASEKHQNKIDDCKKVGIKLLYVWESDFERDEKKICDLIESQSFDDPIFHILQKDSSKKWTTPKPLKRVRKMMESVDPKPRKVNSYYIFGKDFAVKDFSAKKKNFPSFEKAKKNEIELLTVYPWHDSSKILKFIEYKTKQLESQRVYARKCSVQIEDSVSKEIRDFFENNHILGYGKFRRVKSVISLKYEDQTIASGVFCEIDEKTVELKRLAFSYGFSVPGGASKIMKNYFKIDENCEKIITFSDNDLGWGSVYPKIGFTELTGSRGDKVWYNPKTGQKFTNKSLYMIGADRLLVNHPKYEKVGIGEDLPSNSEIVESYGFIPIMDSGYSKWELNRS